jgi:hypothetical protein
MERRFVNDDFANACSGGLHVGSLEYALGWAGVGGRVVIVSVDPADVVTVPTHETTKLRVCSYTVVGEYTQKLPDTYSGEYARPEDTEVEEYDAEAEAYHDKLWAASNPTDDWSKGYEVGKKHGIGHVKRMYYEVDRGSKKLKKTSPEFLDGYLAGYRENRTK